MNYRVYPSDVEPKFNIVDLDQTDRYREIAVSEYGESDDSATTFIKYDGESLEVIGTVPGFYGRRYVDGNPAEGLGNVLIDGSGVISTVQTSFFLMTWANDAAYRFEDGATLAEIEKDLYPLDHEVTLLADLTLAKSRIDQSDGITLKKGECVTLKEGDNKKWVSVVNSAGEIGWLQWTKKILLLGPENPLQRYLRDCLSPGRRSSWLIEVRYNTHPSPGQKNIHIQQKEVSVDLLPSAVYDFPLA